MTASRLVILGAGKESLTIEALRRIIYEYTAIYATVDMVGMIKVAGDYIALLRGAADQQVKPCLEALKQIHEHYQRLGEIYRGLNDRLVLPSRYQKSVGLKLSFDDMTVMLDLTPILPNLSFILQHMKASRELIKHQPGVSYRHHVEANVLMFGFVMSVMMMLGVQQVLRERNHAWSDYFAFLPAVILTIVIGRALDQANEKKHFANDLTKLDAMIEQVNAGLISYQSDMIKDLMPGQYPHEQLKEKCFPVERPLLGFFEKRLKTPQEREAIAKVLSRSRNIRSPVC